MRWLIPPAGIYGAILVDEHRGKLNPGPPGKVSIIMPALNEEAFIEDSLISIQGQKMIQAYPESFEIIVADNASDDLTLYLAQSLDVKTVMAYPRGVLQARTEGIEASSGDIIVSVNADTYYPPEWLCNVLYHFHNPDIVAAASVGLFKNRPLDNVALRVWRRIEQKMYGFASAFRRSAYGSTGGFDLSVNPVDAKAVEYEEQTAFRNRLTQFGSYILDAYPVYTSNRRHMCSLCYSKSCPAPMSEYCQSVLAKRRF
jgi:glycosyltransferase involved in cell wall biosynthesis